MESNDIANDKYRVYKEEIAGMKLAGLTTIVTAVLVIAIVAFLSGIL